jgi:hypothetical protein
MIRSETASQVVASAIDTLRAHGASERRAEEEAAKETDPVRAAKTKSARDERKAERKARRDAIEALRLQSGTTGGNPAGSSADQQASTPSSSSDSDGSDAEAQQQPPGEGDEARQDGDRLVESVGPLMSEGGVLLVDRLVDAAAAGPVRRWVGERDGRYMRKPAGPSGDRTAAGGGGMGLMGRSQARDSGLQGDDEELDRDAVARGAAVMEADSREVLASARAHAAAVQEEEDMSSAVLGSHATGGGDGEDDSPDTDAPATAERTRQHVERGAIPLQHTGADMSQAALGRAEEASAAWGAAAGLDRGASAWWRAKAEAGHPAASSGSGGSGPVEDVVAGLPPGTMDDLIAVLDATAAHITGEKPFPDSSETAASDASASSVSASTSAAVAVSTSDDSSHRAAVATGSRAITSTITELRGTQQDREQSDQRSREQHDAATAAAEVTVASDLDEDESSEMA